MEKRYRFLSGLTGCLLFCLFPAATAWANSSWRWAAETRPYDVLPYVVVLTLAIETAALVLLAKIPRIGKLFCVVALANLLSFLAPYAAEYLIFRSDGIYPSFAYYAEHMPVYTVGIVYAIVTLAVELPIVYAALKRDTDNKPRLAWVIIGANLVTTALSFLIEHMFCPGRW